jgi:hypothetical protein
MYVFGFYCGVTVVLMRDGEYNENDSVTKSCVNTVNMCIPPAFPLHSSYIPHTFLLRLPILLAHSLLQRAVAITRATPNISLPCRDFQ